MGRLDVIKTYPFNTTSKKETERNRQKLISKNKWDKYFQIIF